MINKVAGGRRGVAVFPAHHCNYVIRTAEGKFMETFEGRILESLNS
jgi:hypothetical protein